MNQRSPIRLAPALRNLLAVFALALPFALVSLSASAANSCVSKGGVGGTGYMPDGSGVGGTGSPTDDAQGGIGGTGSGVGGTGSGVGGTGSGVGGTGRTSKGGVGGTGRTAQNLGVVGTITGFASLCINGLEVHYGADTPVSANGLPASTADLAVGQVVTLEAKRDATGNAIPGAELAGLSVSILNAVAGPIRAIDAAAHQLQVLGQTVRVTPQTLIADATGIKTFDFLRTGGLVRVSGLRLANGDIVASRIESTLTLAQASVLGPVTQSDADGFSIYGLRIAAADIKSAPIASGEVMVSGRLDGDTLRPERIALAPSVTFTQGIDRLVLEGYIGNLTDSQLTIGGVRVMLSTATYISGGGDLQANLRVQVIGRLLPDLSVQAESILLRRDPLAPPSPESILPPPRGKGISFNKPGDVKIADTGDDRTTKPSLSRTGTTGTGTTVTATTGTPGTTTTGSTTGTGVNSGTLLGGGGNAGGGGIITPGGGTPNPATTLPSVFKFDNLDFRMHAVRPGKP